MGRSDSTALSGSTGPSHCIRPGRLFLDTSGRRIQAHGGSIFYEDGTYYLYGENKELTDGRNGIWHKGVRAYRSHDLYNWEDLGVIIPARPDDPESSLHPTSQMDRPHIVRCERTGKYVCWVKIMGRDGAQSMTILQADRLLGPYEVVVERMQPLGMSSGDFDLAVGADGRAYIYFERVHCALVCADLTPDYLGVTGAYSTHFAGTHPPLTREAPAHFERGGKHYLITSGTTGYLPNPSQVAVADDWHGPYRLLGDPHGDPSRTSFHSQVSDRKSVV